MKTLIIELKKEKRTGIIFLMPALGLLGGAYALLNFIVRKDTLLSLPLAPMTILLTQLYGMIMTLNLFGIIVAACMIYNIEFKGNAVKKMYVLPIHVPAMYLCKFLILTVLLSIAITLQDLALTKIGITNLPRGSFELFIASLFENMWISLGIGVAGFLSGMALGVPKIGLFLADPFVIMLKPAVSMSTRPDVSVIAIAIVETLLFLSAGLWTSANIHYE